MVEGQWSMGKLEQGQKLFVPLGSLNRRRRETGAVQAGFERRAGDLTDDSLVNDRIADDSAVNIAAPRLELRLDQRDRLPAD